MNTLTWLRSDLRLHDNPALAAAAEQGSVTALFMPAPGQWRAHEDAPAKIDFWLRNLRELSLDLAQLNIPLKLLPVQDWTQAPQTLARFCAEHQIAAVHVNAQWGLDEQRRDSACAAQLADSGITWSSHHGGTLLRPGTVLTSKAEPYRVFTPYAKVCRERLRNALPRALAAPATQAPLPWAADPLPAAFEFTASAPATMSDLWPAGEIAAEARLRAFVDERIAQYQQARDLPAVAGTSSLSPYLTAGVLSPAQCLRAALAANQGEIDSGGQGARCWITELLWREFYQHLLAAYPTLSMHQPMRAQTQAIPWRQAPDELRAWQQGRTGIPIVDAAQRQLLATGWMHNRLRMISAMFLSKNLLIDWRAGESWFMRHLIDGELAANNGGWQWSASTGADAAPYFRIFNSVSQSRKFDPQGQFLRRWLPELSELNDAAIHEPSAQECAATGYPPAMVNLKQSRLRALEAFGNLSAAP